MKKIVEVPLASGDSILVETEVTEMGKVHCSAADEVIKAAETMEATLKSINPLVSGIIGNLMNSAVKPDEVNMELGLGLSFGSDGVLKMLLATQANASFKVGIIWKKP
jgi:hypothetical protein